MDLKRLPTKGRIKDVVLPVSVQGDAPPVISWFINYSKYRYLYHKP